MTSSADAGGTCPGAACTLRQAIATAAAGDTINFAAGLTTITLTSAELVLNKNLTINGPGSNLLTVRRSSTPGTPDFRIFNLATADNVTISRLTIADGNMSGIATSGTLIIVNSTISSNSTTGDGGGIYNNFGTLTITNSSISDNSAGNDGGGIYNYFGTITVTNSTLSGNLADDEGGAIYNHVAALTITSSTVSGNLAGQDGGGIYNNNGVATATITSSTISGNDAVSGGGVYNRDGTLNARNTIIAGNNPVVGGSSPDVSGALSSQGHNLIGNTAGATITGTTTGNQLNIDPLLDPLQNNGGPTQTHALLSGSPAIDKGQSSGSITDQRGFSRPVDTPAIANANGGDGSDIGAYEVQGAQLPGCSTVVTNNDDDGPGSLRFLIAGACVGSTITFAPNVTGAIDLTSAELLINKNLTISGPGANQLSVRRGAMAGNFRIFNISPSTVIATISGLTISNGNSSGSGGGIFNQGGDLTLRNAAVSANVALNGGGVFNGSGKLTITGSTLSGNTLNPIIAGSGGGIFNSGGTLSITDSTITGNTAHGNGNGDSGGGIITNVGTVMLTNSTITGNTGDLGGGIRNINGGTVVSRSTIIALNTSASGPDLNGPLTSQGFNLFGVGVAITAMIGDQIGVEPAQLKLGPLQDNGGPTQTHALLAGSTAIDRGHSFGSNTDQRGFTRAVDNPAIANAGGGDGSDIGAYEVQPQSSLVFRNGFE